MDTEAMTNPIVVKFPRPPFMVRPMEEVPTTRVCAEEGCDQPAHRVNGHYLVGSRQVRVWVCKDHESGDPFREVPPPYEVQYALDKEAEHLENMRKHYTRDVHPEKSESVKVLASTGFGVAYPVDRIKSWRWGA